MGIINSCMFAGCALLHMLGFNVVSHKPDPIHSFGEHDRANTKGLFAEMMQNHSGTKTEMFYRTAGAFELLEECRQGHKKDPSAIRFHSDCEDIRDAYQRLSEEIVESATKEHNALISDPIIAEINTLLQKTFQEARKEYKGAGKHFVYPTLYISDRMQHVTAAHAITCKDKVVLQINFQEIIDMRNFLEKAAALQKYMSREEFLRSVLKYKLQHIKSLLFHELSHPISFDLHCSNDLQVLGDNRAKFEAYTNTLAVLNSPNPKDTARNLYSGYHDNHLPGLIKALEAEQNEKRRNRTASIKECLAQKGEYNPATGAARFILSEQAML